MNFAIGLFILLAGGYLLVIGKSLLVPLVIAVFIWFLIKAMAVGIKHKVKIQYSFINYSLATLILLSFIIFPIQLVASSVPDVIEALPTYEANILRLFESVIAKSPVDLPTITQGIKDNLHIASVLSTIANGLKGFTGNLLLVLLYIGFLFAEQNTMKNKMLATAENISQRRNIQTIINHINKRVTTYIWVKTQLSLLTAIVSYLIMLAIGLDFAIFWALLIFIFNFIPNIGSFIGTIFPALLAIVQFDTLAPAAIVLIGIGFIQFAIGNILEPKLMGDSLNLSPLTIMFSLILWGSIWGIAGLFLSVPITVIIVIILSEFPSTRPIAILFSSNGKVKT